jgi:predicted ATPase/class 3 adenylate cyclase
MGAPSGLVTLLFTDIEGSTKAWEAHPDEMKVALARHDELVRRAIESGGGHVFKTVGDAFCAAFQEAAVALDAAVSAQQLLGAEQWPDATPIRVRMALHSGTCEERSGDYFGPVVNRAARLEAVAHGGQLVLSRLTAELLRDRLPEGISLRDLGEHRLKDLGHPEGVFLVCAEGLASDFPPLRSLDNPALHHNLAEQISSFVGREREVAEVGRLLHDARLVTLAGPGGVGKTRLALQAAAESLDGSGDGAWFVDLAPIADPALVASTVARVLWVREQAGRPITESLIDGLRDRSVLVVLDNCEHVIGAAATLAEALIRRCPRVALLATSREPLGIPGEQVYRVPSLSVPGRDDDLSTLAACEAVRLFVERAGQQKPNFAVDGDNAEVIGRVCRRLDGIPFAIELAAARLRSLSVRDLDSHLDKRFRLLTGGSRTALPRQQTLEALIGWSYDLLSRPEQAVLARLCVFAGGFDMEAAEAVSACRSGDQNWDCVEDFEVLGLVDTLVDKSLVQADDFAGTVRYRLLESVRDYAAARLAERDQAEQTIVHRAHRDHFLAVAEAARPHLRGPGEVEWADRLDVELDNLRVALSECLTDDDAGFGLRLADALSEFWFVRGYGVEGADTLRAHLARPEARARSRLRGRALAAAARLVEHYGADYSAAVALAGEALTIARTENDEALAVKALYVLAEARNLQDDHRGCLRLIDEALPIARRLGDPLPTAHLLNMRGWALDVVGEDGRPSFEESAAQCRRAGDRRGAATAVGNTGFVALEAGDLDIAGALIGEALQVYRELGNRQGLASCAVNAGYVAYLRGDDTAAQEMFRECLDIARRIGARLNVAYAVLGLAITATRAGDVARAAVLHGAFDSLFQQMGSAAGGLEARLRDADHARLRTVVGDESFERSYQAGMHLSSDEVLKAALERTL